MDGTLPLMILLLRVKQTLGTSPEELLLAQHRHSLPVDVPVLREVDQVHQRSITRQLRFIHHLSATTDGTVGVVCAPSIVHRALIVMALRTGPPDHLPRALRHVLRRQPFVSLVIPLRREIGTTGRQRNGFHVHSRTEGTLILDRRARVCSMINYAFPDVAFSLVALPPHTQ